MTNTQLNNALTVLYETNKDKLVSKSLIAKAVSLGMQYRESQFLDGWQAILSQIHSKGEV